MEELKIMLMVLGILVLLPLVLKCYTKRQDQRRRSRYSLLDVLVRTEAVLFTVRTYCAGQLREVRAVKSKAELEQYVKTLKGLLERGEIVFRSVGSTFIATELCYDVYDATGEWQEALSRALKTK